MAQFEINFIAPVDVSASEVVQASSPDAARAIALSDHALGKLSWLFGNVDIGGYTGPVTAAWAVPAGPGLFQVSLTAHVQISASAGSVEAEDSSKAQVKGTDMHARGLLPWNYRGISLGTFTGQLGPLWAVPQTAPSRLATSTQISPNMPSFRLGRSGAGLPQTFASGRSGGGGGGGGGGPSAPPVATPAVTFSITPKSGTATVLQAVVTGLDGTPTGTVVFKDNGTPIGFVSLSNGLALLLYRQGLGAAGSHVLQASYGGDGIYGALDSDFVTFTSSAFVGTPAIASQMDISISQDNSLSTTVTVNVYDPRGESGTPPTGFVIIEQIVGGAPVPISGLISLTATGGQSSTATFTSSNWSSPTNSLSAYYMGDGSHGGQSSPGVDFHYVGGPAPILPDASFTYGIASSLYARVTEGATGQVDFIFNGNVFDTENVDAFGVATLNTVSLPPGDYSVSAAYGGDSQYGPSQSGSIRAVIGPAGTRLSMSLGPSPSSTGETVFCIATVRPSNADSGLAGAVQPIEGRVEFFFRTPSRTLNVPGSGAFLIPPGAPVSFGLAAIGPDKKAYLDTTVIPIGEYEVYCSYGGNPYYAGSDSPPITIAVAKGAPGMVFQVSPSPTSIGSSLSMRATVFPLGPTGDVQFIRRVAAELGTADVILDTQPLDANGIAVSPAVGGLTGSITTLSNLYAKYVGDDSFFATEAKAPNVVVQGYSTSVSFTQDTASPSYGQTFSITAIVSASGGGVPTGSVHVFGDDGTPYGTAVLSGGSATFSFNGSVTHPPVGSSIYVTYPGDGTHVASGSSAAPTGVLADTTVTTLSSSINPSPVGSPTILTAHVTSAHGAALDGTVSFLSGVSIVGSVPVSSSTGNASASVSFSQAGPKSLTASYLSSSGNFASSVSGALTQGVQAPASVGVGISPTNPYSGQTIRFTAVVSSSTAGTPTGSVTFRAYKYAGGWTYDHDIGSAAVDGTGAAHISGALQGGQYWQIHVAYAGDNTYTPCNNNASNTYFYVGYIPTTTSISVSPQYYPYYGVGVSMTASVVGADGAPVNGGTVYFYSDQGLEGSAAVSNGSATAFTHGYYQSYIYAYYAGNATHQSSSSSNETVLYGYY